MGQLTITLPDDLEAEVREQVNIGNYGSVSDYVRDALRNSSVSKEPTYWRRLELALMLDNNRLLHKLNGDSWGHEPLLEGLQSGYPSAYQDMDEIVSRNPLTHQESEAVYEVLGMYERLQLSVRESKDDDLIKRVEFEGFDGNYEPRLLGFVRFLVQNQQFAHVKPLDKTPSLNSHGGPNMEVYQRMLEVYRPIKASKPFGKYMLTIDEVKKVIAGRIHPENR